MTSQVFTETSEAEIIEVTECTFYIEDVAEIRSFLSPFSVKKCHPMYSFGQSARITCVGSSVNIPGYIFLGLELSSGAGGQVVVFKPYFSLVVARLALATVPTKIEPIFDTTFNSTKFHPECEHLTGLIAVATGDQLLLVEYGKVDIERCVIRFFDEFKDIPTRLKEARARKQVLGFKPRDSKYSPSFSPQFHRKEITSNVAIRNS